MKKQIYFDRVISHSPLVIAIRNGDKTFHVGDWFGGAKVLKIEAYGKDLDSCGEGLTAAVTMTRMPGLLAEEDCPEAVEYYEKLNSKPRNF